MRGNVKVRVKRDDLLKIVEMRLRKAEREHKRALDTYPAQVTTWETAAVAKLEKALAAAQQGKFPDSRYGQPMVPLGDPPLKPSVNGRELCDLRRLHKLLSIGAEESILLSQADCDQYFGPCPT